MTDDNTQNPPFSDMIAIMKSLTVDDQKQLDYFYNPIRDFATKVASTIRAYLEYEYAGRMEPYHRGANSQFYIWVRDVVSQAELIPKLRNLAVMLETITLVVVGARAHQSLSQNQLRLLTGPPEWSYSLRALTRDWYVIPGRAGMTDDEKTQLEKIGKSLAENFQYQFDILVDYMRSDVEKQ